MSPKHTNPSWDKSRYDRNARQEVRARAPYNFVSLSENIVCVPAPLPQDHFEALSGWIDCELETKSPVYIRGMLTEDQYREQGQLDPAELSDEQKEERAPFFKISQNPLIPGSSLRGMIRMLVEITGFGRMRWVGKEPSFSFRAVAAQKDDPLRDPYQNALGRFGVRVKAGYLVYNQQTSNWSIQPAQMPQSLGLAERNGYLKVKEWILTDLPWYTPFRHREYRPTYYPVSFDTENRRGEKGQYAAITKIDKKDAGLKYQGVLVCSGNMIETDASGRTPRKNQALILPADPKSPPLSISKEVLEAYKFSLTPFQREALMDWQGGEWGCLRHGAPVFYVAENGRVLYFGYSPNFRIPAYLHCTKRAAVPADFVPSIHQENQQVDFADALFGWTPEPGSSRKDSCAGRVFFEDARLNSDQQDIWYSNESTTPHVLGTPKPTTFQHYLVQDRKEGHDPDDKATLAHYGTPKAQTQIRGHKMYWHRGRSPEIKASAKEREHETQLTRIRPLKPGVHFHFRVRFENLREAELGALLWAVNPRGDAGKTYCHKLGMGKPLGMGAIQLHPVEVHLTERKEKRYKNLFTEKDGELAWESGDTPVEIDYRGSFEDFMVKAVSSETSFQSIERVQELLTMLEWRGDDPGQDWLEWTRYMEIEHLPGKVNEYKERPVLPNPGQVVRWAAGDHSVEPLEDTPTAPAPNTRQTQPSSRQTTDERPVIVQSMAVQSAPEQLAPPQPGATLHGEVLDIEPGGKVWLDITDCPAPEGVEVTGVIYASNMNDKKFTEGMRIRLEVIEVKVSPKEWLVSCRPGAKSKK